MGLSEGIESLRTLEEAPVGSDEISGVAVLGVTAIAAAAAQAQEGTIEGETVEGSGDNEGEIEAGGTFYDKFGTATGTTFTTIEIEGGEGTIEGTEVEGEGWKGRSKAKSSVEAKTLGVEAMGRLPEFSKAATEATFASGQAGVGAIADFWRSFCDSVILWIT
jgi:hypothetical protein